MQNTNRSADRSTPPDAEPVARVEDPCVTVVVVPRERFSQTQRSLEDLFEHTTLPFHLIYVDAGAPPQVRRYLEEAAERRHFELIQVNRFLSPNEARNLAQRRVKTKYVVFLDNDVLLTPRWLEQLVRCAEETGAWVVGPLYLIGELSQQTIHMAGGMAHVTEEGGRRVFYDEHLLADSPLADSRGTLARRLCDYVEFHCSLIRNDVFERLGQLDEGLLSVHEHIDLGLLVQRAGGSVYFEPGSVVTYVPPPPYDARDFPYFMMRWSEAWNEATVRHFKEKWGYSSVRFFGDPPGRDGDEETILRWARGHRRLMTGLRVSRSMDDRPDSLREEARCMVALFLSVERESFDLTLAAGDEDVIDEAHALNAQDVFDRLSEMTARAEEEDLNVLVRPLPSPVSHPVALLRMDDVNEERLARVRSYSFLVLETGPKSYQCWLAVARGDPRSAAIWRRLGATARAGAAGPVRIAGSRIVDGLPGDGRRARVRLVDGCAGLLHPLSTLDAEGLLPILRYSLPA